MLSSLTHINPGFYEESGMHGGSMVPVETWLRETDWDDQRRFEMLKSMITNRNVLDFGSGAGGFLCKAKTLAAKAEGIELEKRVHEFWGEKLTLHKSPDTVDGKFDVITAFHVIEHLVDPLVMLRRLADLLDENGCLVVEVPSADDVLLTLYDSEAFQRFTYWSQHLFLFNAETLRRLGEQAGLRVVAIKQYQRYPLSNHLYWLSQQQPGGHKDWSFLDSPQLSEAYASALSAVGKCDTLIGYFEKSDSGIS